MKDEIKNLWPTNKDKTVVPTDGVMEILEKQSYFFNEMYGEKIKAELHEVKKYQSITTQLVVTMTKSLGIGEKYVHNDQDIKALDNINTVLNNNTYSFIIKNNFFRFDMFYIKIGMYFPVIIEVDYDIAEEMNEKEISINSIEDLSDILYKIFRTKKVQFVIEKLLEYDNKIIDTNN